MSVQWGWVSKQLAETNKAVNEATVATLKAFDDAKTKHLITDDEAREVLEHVQSLALGYAIVKDKPDERWTQVVPGEYNIGDTVRVHSNAYEGRAGLLHNGKRGRIVGVAQSKTIVLYNDAATNEESFYHEPIKLERLL